MRTAHIPPPKSSLRNCSGHYRAPSNCPTFIHPARLPRYAPPSLLPSQILPPQLLRALSCPKQLPHPNPRFGLCARRTFLLLGYYYSLGHCPCRANATPTPRQRHANAAPLEILPSRALLIASFLSILPPAPNKAGQSLHAINPPFGLARPGSALLSILPTKDAIPRSRPTLHKVTTAR